MEIEILEFIPDRKESRQGYVDFIVKHSPDKYEIFRGIALYEKGLKRWLMAPKIKRDEGWKYRYERKPSLGPIFEKALHALEEYIKEMFKAGNLENKEEGSLKGEFDIQGFCTKGNSLSK